LAGKIDTSFIIVLWLEPRELPGRPEWRWKVTGVQTGNEAYFSRLTDLMSYVSDKAGVEPPN